jgi:hypothetical protein
MLEHNWECNDWLEETVVLNRETARKELAENSATLPKSENSTPPSRTQYFVHSEFVALLEKGRNIAERMSAILSGRYVKRSYFYKEGHDGRGRVPLNIFITKIASEDGGIIRIYDSTGTIRELPSLLFEFWFRPEGVICHGPDFTLLLEVVS